MNKYYGTLKECVDNLFERADKEGKFPDFDYAAEVPDDAVSAEDASRKAEGWFCCKDISELFDGGVISLVFGYYGGGVLECCVLDTKIDRIKSLKQKVISWIGNSTDLCGYGVLENDDHTVFEYDD